MVDDAEVAGRGKWAGEGTARWERKGRRGRAKGEKGRRRRGKDDRGLALLSQEVTDGGNLTMSC